MAAHADRLAQLEADVETLGGRVETLYFEGASERIGLAVPHADLSMPASVVRVCDRRETVSALCQTLGAVQWVALHGGPVTGKTQLALQVARTYGVCRGWVRHRYNQSAAEAHRVLEAALASMADKRPALSHLDWLSDAFGRFGPNTVIVLDDLPRIPNDDPFTEWLGRVGHAARIAGVRIISTSQHELPIRLRHCLGDTNLNDRPTPPFTDAEACDLLRAYGADEDLLSARRLGFLNGLAAGHPLLLAATAEFLAKRDWQYREEEIDALLRGDHTRPILPEVIDRLVRTLNDSSKEFLYRVSLTIGGFDPGDMAAVAGVAPVVERPMERLNEILGAWVQRDTDTRYAVSPLVKPLGRSELRTDVRKNCFRRLAEAITSRLEMNSFEGERAILYNLEADEHEKAVTLYMLFLVEALREPKAEHVAILIDKWRTTPLPARLDVGNRLIVRAYQLKAFTKYDLDAHFVTGDIESLLAEATDREGWAVVALIVQNLRWYSRKDPSRLIRYIRRAMELPCVYGPDGREIVFDAVSIPDLLWTTVTDLRTPDLLGQWFDAVEVMPARHRAGFWASDLGRHAVRILPNKVYTTEWENPRADQDWEGLLEALDSLLARAERLHQPRLEAVITGIMLEILGDHKRVDDTPQVAERTLARWPADPDVQFRVRSIWGRQYAYGGQPDHALSLIDAALVQPHAPDDHERLRCLLAASICVGELDLRYSVRARDLARSSQSAPPIEAARALGEYAVSLFRTQDGPSGCLAAFLPWSEAVRSFLGIPAKDKIWKDLFPLFAHATSYLYHIAQNGVAPERTIEGDRFVAPSRGFFLKDYLPGREALYSESGVASLAVLMQAYAVLSKADDEAVFWMRLAVDEAKRTGATSIQIASGSETLARMLVDRRFADAVEMSVLVGRGLVAARARRSQTRSDFESTWNVDTEFRQLPEDQRRRGDTFALITGIIPSAMAVVSLSLDDPPGASTAGNRIAALCRELAGDPFGDQGLWHIAAEFYSLASAQPANAAGIVERVREIEGDGEREVALRILGYILSSWHATPREVISFQLGMSEMLLRWYPPGEATCRSVLLPYAQSYWQNAVKQYRFALRAPDVVAGSLESAASAPERERVYAILSAAAGGFQIQGARDVLQRLRQIVQ